jgi:hypothetical protein
MPDEIVFGRIAATLPVADMARALAFYERPRAPLPRSPGRTSWSATRAPSTIVWPHRGSSS